MSYLNPYDEYKLYKNLNDFLDKHTQKQKHNDIIYKQKQNEYIIRDNKGCIKIVSKNYYLYHTKNDEYETETEFEVEEWLDYTNSVKQKYNI